MDKVELRSAPSEAIARHANESLAEETARRLKEAGFCVRIEGSVVIVYLRGRPAYTRHVLSAVEGLPSSAIRTVQEGSTAAQRIEH